MLNKRESYTKITSRLTERLDKLHAEDKTNITNTTRGIKNYNNILNTNIKKIIRQQAKLLGRKINVLDAGCGQAHAIDELLSDEELKNELATCTGISLHYFDNVKKVMEKHGDRFIYYRGDIQEVLKNMCNKFDIIVDAWGAYCYSKDKIQVLKLYHQALTPHGDAEIFIKNKNSAIILDDKQKKDIPKICKQYPDTFTEHKHTNKHRTDKKKSLSAITLTKSSERFPLLNYHIKTFKEVRSFHSGKSLETLRKGNAVHPDKVKYIHSSTSRELRALPYKRF